MYADDDDNDGDGDGARKLGYDENMGYVRMYAYVPMLRVRGVASGI